MREHTWRALVFFAVRGDRWLQDIVSGAVAAAARDTRAAVVGAPARRPTLPAALLSGLLYWHVDVRVELALDEVAVAQRRVGSSSCVPDNPGPNAPRSLCAEPRQVAPLLPAAFGDSPIATSTRRIDSACESPRAGAAFIRTSG